MVITTPIGGDDDGDVGPIVVVISVLNKQQKKHLVLFLSLSLSLSLSISLSLLIYLAEGVLEPCDENAVMKIKFFAHIFMVWKFKCLVFYHC